MKQHGTCAQFYFWLRCWSGHGIDGMLFTSFRYCLP